MGNPLCESLDEDRAYGKFACNVIDRRIPASDLLLNALDDILKLIIRGYRDIEKVREIRKIALEIGPELTVYRPEFFFRLFPLFRHPPLLFNQVTLPEDFQALFYSSPSDLFGQLFLGHPCAVEKVVNLFMVSIIEGNKERDKFHWIIHDANMPGQGKT
jgi:hypothetical protein